MKPLDPRLLREARAARWFIAGVVALAALGVFSTLVIAWNLTRFITEVFVSKVSPEKVFDALVWVALAGVIKAAAIWLQEVWANQAASAARSELRVKFIEAITRKSSVGQTIADTSASRHLLATRGLDALDAYFSKYLPQLVFTVIVTPVFWFVIWSTDQLSGVILAATLPMIPLFMVLIGWATRAVQQKQLDALTRLSQHFLEVMRGLTTLKVFGREKAQIGILSNVGEEYRKRTMKVLSVSFLSGFALELAASLSVALMAVSIGFRLLDGSLALATGLFVLLLAPEAYLPLRMVGANFHAASEGVAASKAVLDLIQESESVSAGVEAQQAIDLDVEPGRLTVLVGKSGSGKTTKLQQLRQVLGDEAIAWMPQANFVFNGSVLENIVGQAKTEIGDFDNDALQQALSLSQLDDLGLETLVGSSGSAISGGQRQRVALARAFYRVISSGLKTMLLDEPLSAIDSKRARSIIENLKSMAAEGVTIIAVSHQDQLVSAADSVFEVSNV